MLPVSLIVIGPPSPPPLPVPPTAMLPKLMAAGVMALPPWPNVPPPPPIEWAEIA